jgi:AbrB family looped-hinge helix DNA binding protein
VTTIKTNLGKQRGMVRNICDLGRVVIPKEYRRILGIENVSPIEISLYDDDTVTIRKYTPDMKEGGKD